MDEQTLTFLTELFGAKPEKSAVQLWHRIDARRSRNSYFDDLKACAVAVSGIAGDCYVAAGLAPAKLPSSSTTRLAASGVAGIPGVWADIDVNGGPEGKTGAAATVEQATELANSLLTPTILISSGYGIQAWWLFEDGPWMFTTVEERDQAARLSQAFQGALRAQARRMGFGIDSTHDLARLMRIPGGRNHKGAEPVNVAIIDNEGDRYSVDQIGSLSHTHLAAIDAPAKLRQGEGIEITVDVSATPPLDKLEALLDLDLDFKGMWNHQRNRKTATWSLSEYEFSLTNSFVVAGWSDQEICDALVYHRNKWEPGDPKHKNRAERIALTIGKVRASRMTEAIQAEIQATRSEAADALEEIGISSDPQPVRTVSLFNQIVGGPEIARLLQNSRDPELARFALEMADGEHVPLGRFSNLCDQRRFRQIYGIITGHYFEMVGAKKWDGAIRSLLRTAIVQHTAADTRVAMVRGWVEDHVDKAASRDRDGACANRDPFMDDGGKVFLFLSTFHQYLRRARGERIEEADLKALLRAAGFERKAINYRTPEGKRSSRSYYIGAMADLTEPDDAGLLDGGEALAGAAA